MIMSDQNQKEKTGLHSRTFPSSKYEKVRRDRLNFFIAELSTFLPEQNPAKALSKIDILEKVVQLIKNLLDQKEKVLNKNSADQYLKEEIMQLKKTVNDLKARICTLNKILKKADIHVPIDLEVPHIDKITPHLKYSVMRKVFSTKQTQTDISQEKENEKKEKPTEINNKQDENDETVEKLISFTKNLKAPLKEINNMCASSSISIPHPPPPTLRPIIQQLPTQIIVVPYIPNYYPPVLPKRSAVTQLTFSNKRPISSYIDFKKNYDEQQERKKKKKRKIRKCVCKSVLIKKPDQSTRKALKICGNKLCKNKSKLIKIKENQKKLKEQSQEKVKTPLHLSELNDNVEKEKINESNVKKKEEMEGDKINSEKSEDQRNINLSSSVHNDSSVISNNTMIADQNNLNPKIENVNKNIKQDKSYANEKKSCLNEINPNVENNKTDTISSTSQKSGDLQPNYSQGKDESSSLVPMLLNDANVKIYEKSSQINRINRTKTEEIIIQHLDKTCLNQNKIQKKEHAEHLCSLPERIYNVDKVDCVESIIYKSDVNTKKNENCYFDSNSYFNPLDIPHSGTYNTNNSNQYQNSLASQHINQSWSYSINNVISQTHYSNQSKSTNATSNMNSVSNYLAPLNSTQTVENNEDFRSHHSQQCKNHSEYIPSSMMFNSFPDNDSNQTNILPDKKSTFQNLANKQSTMSSSKSIFSENHLQTDLNLVESNISCAKIISNEQSGDLQNSRNKSTTFVSPNSNCNVQSKNDSYGEINSVCRASNDKFNLNETKTEPIHAQSYHQSRFNHLNPINNCQQTNSSENNFNVNNNKVQEPSFLGFYKQRNIIDQEVQSLETQRLSLPNFSHKNDSTSNNQLKQEHDSRMYPEPCQEKSSCLFESHPNTLHFPYIPNEKSDLQHGPTKIFEESKRKSIAKSKTESDNAYLLPPKLSQSHDISQNIFEVNKENSFDFLFGKQNPTNTTSEKTSLNTPHKNKRKSDISLNNLMSEETKPIVPVLNDKNSFIPLSCLDEMRFSFPNSEFSNDIFSLQGHVGSQNIESVSPTAAFLLTFPLVSSKNAELLTDNANIETGNAGTPSTLIQIGNIESLSQDLFPPQQDVSFKSNMKGLFDPFYTSCISGDGPTMKDTKLNFDFNTDSIKDEFSNKQNFSVPNVANAWSSNLFSNVNESKKKINNSDTTLKDGRLNFDFNLENTSKVDQQSFLCSNISSSSITPSSATTAWSSNLFNSSKDNKKKVIESANNTFPEITAKAKKPFEVKYLQSSQATSSQTHSQGSQTMFTYAGNSEIEKPESNSKSLVNWMTSYDKTLGPEPNMNGGSKIQLPKKTKNYTQNSNAKLPFTSIEHSLDFLEKQNKITSWSPTKSIPLLPPLELMVPSTLPSLIGDLALGTNSSLFTTSTSVHNVFSSGVSTIPSSSISFPSAPKTSMELFSNSGLAYTSTFKSSKIHDTNNLPKSSTEAVCSNVKHQTSSKIENQHSSQSQNAVSHMTPKSADSKSEYNQNKSMSVSVADYLEQATDSKPSNTLESDFTYKKQGYANTKDASEKDMKFGKKSAIKILPQNEIYREVKENTIKSSEYSFPPSQCYYSNVSVPSTSSSFLSVSQLVDPVKSDSNQEQPKENKTNNAKSICKGNKITQSFKQIQVNENKTNYSAEALLSSPQKNDFQTQKTSSIVQLQNQFKPAETKSRYKRRKTDSFRNTKATLHNFTPAPPIPFSSTMSMPLYSIPSSSSGSYYSSSNYYNIAPYQPTSSSVTSFTSSGPTPAIFNSYSSSNVAHDSYYISTSTSSIPSTSVSYLPPKSSYSNKNNYHVSNVSENFNSSINSSNKPTYLESLSCPSSTSNQSAIGHSYIPSVNSNFFPNNSAVPTSYSESCLQTNHQNFTSNVKNKAITYYPSSSATKPSTSYSCQGYDVQTNQFNLPHCQSNSASSHTYSFKNTSSSKTLNSSSNISYLPSSHFQNVVSCANIFTGTNSQTTTQATSTMYSMAPSWHTPICSAVIHSNNTPTSSSLSGQNFSPFSASISSSVPSSALPKYSSTLPSITPSISESTFLSCSKNVSSVSTSSLGHSFPTNSSTITSKNSSSFYSSFVTNSTYTSSTTAISSSHVATSTSKILQTIPKTSVISSVSSKTPFFTSASSNSRSSRSNTIPSTRFHKESVPIMTVSSLTLKTPQLTGSNASYGLATSTCVSSSVTSFPYTSETFSYSNSFTSNIGYPNANTSSASVPSSNLISMPSYSNSMSQTSRSMSTFANSLVPSTSFAITSASNMSSIYSTTASSSSTKIPSSSFSTSLQYSASSSSLYTPVSSSITNFNLSTIFPEINDKNQSGVPMYNYQNTKDNDTQNRNV